MDAAQHELEALLEAVREGRVDPRTAAERLRGLRDLGFAVVDHARARRCGFPEVILCEGKRKEQVAAIATEVLTRAPRVLLTRAGPEDLAAVRSVRPDAVWHERARCIVVDPTPLETRGTVAVVAAGTSDLPVAEEAGVTAATLGCRVERHFDVGIAGLARLLRCVPAVREADAIVAVAGMEGALPSVLAGLVDVPLVAVPTSVGYGVGLGGIAALATMLASCAAGVTVVNIDNGFGAGYAAARIARRTAPRPAS